MRIFLYGNEERAKWHLPVVEAKFRSFVMNCKARGLKQDRFTMHFEEDGTVVFGQYFYGSESIQIYSPGTAKVVEEKSTNDFSGKVLPKTFWVSTAKGYYWIEVRYDDETGLPVVVLTPFEAKKEDDSFVYPGIGSVAPGMIAGCFSTDPKARYVLAQNGAVLIGVEEEKGTIKSTEIIDKHSRVTVVENELEQHDYVLMLSSGGKTAEIRRVQISFAEGDFVISRQYASIDMVTEGETNLSVTSLLPNPAWVHRKCSGSYVSPSKTIGYHVDIGTDDEFLGNMMSVAGADLLDNTGGFEEALFNHTPDLYRIAGIFSFPVAVDSSEVQVILVAPTMGFSGTAEDKCWGGYGLTQSWASCVDYRQDFNSWLLSPRPVLVTINLQSGAKSYSDFMSASSSSSSYDVMSWDGKFSGSVVIEAEYSCDTDFYSDMTTKDADDQCAWTEECGWTCDTNDPGSTGECAKGWTPYKHWEYFSRENILNSRRMYFLFGNNEPHPQCPSDMHGFYFLFDGLWHLDIGVLWTTSKIIGDLCGLCVYPYGSQTPGQNVYFAVQGVDTAQLLSTGHEYVENMEIVVPLGHIAWPNGGTQIGFIARVPEEYAAPHEPVLMKGGIEYQSGDVEGETVFCERALMSAPCICEGNTMAFHDDSIFELAHAYSVRVVGGCPPFEWAGINAEFNGKSFEVTDVRNFIVEADDDCYASIQVKDACGTMVSMSDTYSKVGVVVGDDFLDAGEESLYTHNLDEATYTGTLEVVEYSGNSFLLRMPSYAEQGAIYTASWSGKCGVEVSKNIQAVSPPCCPSYSAVGIWGQCNYGPLPSGGSFIYIINYKNNGTNVCLWLPYIETGFLCTSPVSCPTVGGWLPLFPWQGGGNQLWVTAIPSCAPYGYGSHPGGRRNVQLADNPSYYC